MQQLGERVRDHLRSLDVLDGDRVPVIGVGVQRGVVTCRDGDLRQLLHRGPEFVHVTPGRHGVLGDESVPERRVELSGTAVPECQVGRPLPALEVGARSRAVGKDDRVHAALSDRRGRVSQEDLPRRTPDTGRVDVVDVRRQAEVLRDVDGRNGPRPVRHEAVDLVARDTGVGECT
jgi:hypothetical protein